MTRIANYGASQLYLSRIAATQQRVSQEQVQVTTEKKSQVYSGIASDASMAINFENEKAAAGQFVKNNQVADTKLQAATTSVDAIRKTIKDFSNSLATLAQGGSQDRAKVEALQGQAFRAMADMSAYLNVSVDGQYMFAGGRVSQEPVNFPYGSLAEFQATFDGAQNAYGTTRAADLLQVDLPSTALGTLSLDWAGGYMTASNVDSVKDLVKGGHFNINGTNANDGDWTSQGKLAMNVAGVPLTETTDIGTAFVTFGTTSANTVTSAAMGTTSAEFDVDGNMVLRTATPGALANLKVGTNFTIQGSTGNAWDGSFTVLKNDNGVVTLTNNTGLGDGESVAVGSLSLGTHSDTDGVPDATVSLGLGSTETAEFTVSGNQVTLNVPSGGTDLTTEYSVGDLITIAGSDNYNGTFTVTAVTATGVSFDINPDAVRLSRTIQQTGRTDVTVDFNSPLGDLTAAQYGSLSFHITASGETITAATAGAFLDPSGNAAPAAGQLFKMISTSGVNDGTYEVVSNDGTNIVIKSRVIADNGGANDSSSTAIIRQDSWYRGDTMTIQHRVDTGRTVDIGLFASDPAFEKAMRAMAMIAQGTYGTQGGLDQNTQRIDQAQFLLRDAIDSPASGTPPFGAEDASDLDTLASRIAVSRKAIANTNGKHNSYVGFLDQRIIDIENVDKTEVIAALLDDQNGLEAAYQALARVRDMSLLNFMK